MGRTFQVFHTSASTFSKAFMMKCLKSTEAEIIVWCCWVLEGCVRLYYGCQGQRLEKETKCIMHTRIWHSVKMKLHNISDCRIHQKLLGQAFIQVFTLRCHFKKVRKGYFYFFCVDIFQFLSFSPPTVMKTAQTLLR